jgi:hypothetical protein
MAGFAAVGDASTTLKNLVEAGVAVLGVGAPLVELNDLADPIGTTPSRVTIFLYDLAEDASVRNAPATRELVGGIEVMRRAPLALSLRYLISAWNPNPATHHTILGRIAQVLTDHAIVTGTELAGSLQSRNEALRLRLLTLDLEERTRVWHAINKPYRLSLYCEARVVRVQSDDVQVAPPVTSMRTDERRREALP